MSESGERVALALIATMGSRFGSVPRERLIDISATTRWLASAGLQVGDLDLAGVDALRSLREAIFDLAHAAATGTVPPRASLEAVNAAASTRPTPVLGWTADGGFQGLVGQLNINAALAIIAWDAITLLTGPDAHRLHECEASTCGTIFIQNQQGQPRRWCSSAQCGNRERVRAFRATRTEPADRR
jgi:predicted RNA-binding Zn ribbon-like protein